MAKEILVVTKQLRASFAISAEADDLVRVRVGVGVRVGIGVRVEIGIGVGVTVGLGVKVGVRGGGR